MMELVPPSTNRLLASLPEAELRPLEPRLEYIRLVLGKPIYEPGEPVRHLYFPNHGIVSLLYVNESGASAEVASVGCEGVVGLSLLLGAKMTTERAMVQVAGSAYRLPAAHARALFAEGGRFQALTLRFAHALMLHMSQTAVCNLHHSVEQQLCRWLLRCLDRLDGNEMSITHELIASILGVRRQGITEAAMKLQRRGIIATSRGRIAVLDRGALEESACECYGVITRQTAAALAL
jgi:CRP-like cAMP-binding protein